MNQPTSDKPFRIGTRASPLAMRQAEMVRDALIASHGWADDAVQLVPMVATGDKIQDRALAEVGGKALWTKELDRALDLGKTDCSVHSMKDVETLRPDRFRLAAMLPRADVRDRLIGATSLDALPQGARIGTSSPRRAAQVQRYRSDFRVVLMRGNVGTRLAKLEAGEADATFLAAAGLDRLGMDDVGAALDVAAMLPAPQQGAIGIEIRSDDADALAVIAAIDDAATSRAVLAERALLVGLGGDCRSPVAALASADAQGMLRLTAQIFAEDGSDMVTGEIALMGGAQENAAQARSLAADMLARANPTIRALFTR
jgi:hydroxymethylbilane synthase